jgi:hypothetical protein
MQTSSFFVWAAIFLQRRKTRSVFLVYVDTTFYQTIYLSVISFLHSIVKRTSSGGLKQKHDGECAKNG